MKSIRCFLLPENIHDQKLADTVVVIDVLRASTTICAALSNGADSILPFQSVEETQRVASEHPETLTGGERGGIRIEGFDLGNSPLEYTPEKIAKRKIAFTTSNGTQAMQACRGVQKILVGAFCNLSRIVECCGTSQNLDLICSGTNGEITLEDSLFAGAAVDQLLKTLNGCDVALNDQANLCRAAWNQHSGDVHAALLESTGGRNLMALGKQADIEFCSRIDSLPLIPRLDSRRWEIFRQE